MGAVDRQRRPRGSRRAVRGRGDPHRPGDQPHGGDHHGPPGALDVAATPGAVWVINSAAGRQRGADRPGDQPGRLRRGCGLDGQLARQLPVPDRPRDQPGRWSPIPIGFRAGNLVVGTGGVWVTSDNRVDAAPRGRGGCAHRPADQPSGRDDRRRWSPHRCRGNQGRHLGCRSQTPARRYGSPGANAASRPGCVCSQAATMSWVVQMGRQEWAGCKCGRRDRLQPIRGYERNVWPPRTSRAGQSIARSAPPSAAAPFP